jgi:hypothetical protein
LPTASAEGATVVANPAVADGANGSLRQRVAAAAASDTVQLPVGTYRLTQGPLTIDKAITLEGLGQRAGQVVITAEGRSRSVLVNPAAATTVLMLRLQVSGGRAVGGAGGGGILKQGAGTLILREVAISGNSASGASGGGLAATVGDVVMERSAVFSNSASVSLGGSGGGGIFHSGGNMTLENVSLARNSVTVSGAPQAAGGSAIQNAAGALALDGVTIGYNTTSPGGLGALRNNSGTQPTLRNTIVSNNGGNCAGALNSLGFNIAGDASCSLGQASDKPSVVPNIQQIADNGGPTPTLRLPPGSIAINEGTCTLNDDQRNLPRPAENETSCDIGAFEFEGWASVEVPPCSRSGQLPFTVASPPETGVEALDYLVGGVGNPASPLQVPGTGANTLSGSITLAEGRRQLEYWADSFPTGTDKGVQAKHVIKQAVVDRTNPRVAVANPNPFRVFVIKRATSVNVNATDSISGLVLDPSGRRPLDTSQRGTKTFAAGAVDLCANSAVAPFSYRVLAPSLGVRTVLERVKGTVLIQPAGGTSSARASQKGRSFSSVREPREVAVRSLVDSRRGTVRLTSSSSRTNIQDSEFSGGVFQVLQSGRRSARGLTEVRLKGSSFRRCGRSSKSDASTSARKKRVIRRLRGNGRGRFRTRGRYSSATVRGTVWTVTDRCDGTLTSVKRGRVAVRDFRRKKTITVRAGKSYLARAPR